MLTGGAVRRAYIDIDGGQLHYRYSGKVNARPIVLLHQSPSSSEMYEGIMQAIGEQYYVLAPDTPGFGASDKISSLSIQSCSQVLKDFLTQLGIERCFLFGHHTGASIAVQFAFDNPEMVTALSLSGPTLLSDELKAILPSKAESFELTTQGGHLQRMWQRIRGKDPLADLSLSMRETLLAFQCGDDYKTAYQAMVEQDFRGQLQDLLCPVQVFAGDKDPFYDCVDATVSLLNQGERAKLSPGSGTYVCDRKSAEVAELILGFYKRTSVK